MDDSPDFGSILATVLFGFLVASLVVFALPSPDVRIRTVVSYFMVFGLVVFVLLLALYRISME